MVIDYKGVSFSFKKIKKKKRAKRLRLIGFIAVIIVLLLFAASLIDSGKIKKIQILLLENKIDDAQARLKNIESLPFHNNAKKELNALIYLFADEVTKARQILDRTDGVATSIDPWKFIDYFSERAEYEKSGIYIDYLLKKKEKIRNGERLLFYKAMVKTGMFNPGQSSEAILKIPAGLKKEKEKALTLIGKINDQLDAGKINYIFDTNGEPLASFDIKKKQTISLIPGISFEAFSNEMQTSIKFYRLTLDRRIQETIHRLFRDFHGSFLLMNVSDSSIAAAYSKPIDPNKKNKNTVFLDTYEPGSIIKLLTLLAYLHSSRGEMFPFQCEGLWSINGQVFYDWLVHHRVGTSEEALAVSCNVAFAKMGVGVGFETLSNIFNRFYFNNESKGLADLFLTFKTGTYNTDITPSSPTSIYRIANLSVGLNEISVTTFHSALISTIISQNGSFYNPHLIKNKKNLLKVAFYNHTGRLNNLFKANTIFLKIKNAMKLVVEAPGGTGKRARVDFINLALKTGTAGDKKSGLDAILTGFFPADNPQYAFAFRLARAGKAEWRGALFLKDFLTAFYRDKPLYRGVK